MKAGSTFNEFIKSGSTIASAPVEREAFEQLIGSVNEQFGLSIEARDDAFLILQDRIRVVAGRFWEETEAIERKSMIDRLTRLAQAVRQVKDQLAPARGGMHEAADFELVAFLSRVMNAAHHGKLTSPIRELEVILEFVERLDLHCDQGLAFLAQLPAKKGQRGMRWYDDLVALMVEVAGLLGIKVATAGDRTGDDKDSPYLTSFTALVFAAETALPPEAQSETLAACAKRIERSLKQRKVTTRQNALKS